MDRSLSRRQFLGRLSLLGAGAVLAPRLGRADATSPLVKRVIQTPVNTYFTYPHCNGFLPDGSLVLARYAENELVNPHREQPLDYLAFHPETQDVRLIGSHPHARTYYSISQTGLLLVPGTHDAQVLDTVHGGGFRKIYELSPDWKISDVSDISPDGKTAALASAHRAAPEDYRIESVDLATGRVTTLMDTSWLTNHVHYSPFDPNWLMFCHEGRADDRIWTWNQKEAPQGRNLFEQRTADNKYFNIGHERAMFHKPATLFVVYAASSATPRGLYEVTFDRQAKPLSVFDRYWHCNISRDGRWAVADTQGPAAATGKLDPLWMKNEGLCDIAAVNLKTGARQILHPAHANLEHPYHPHPHITPDGRWVVFNDAIEKRVILLEIDRAALQAFLA